MANNNATNTANPSGVSAATYTNATVTFNAAGLATSASNGAPGVTWNDSVSTPVTMVAGNGYITDDGATKVVLNLPAVVAVGAEFKVQGKATGLWQLVANTGQTINFGSAPTTSGGSITSTNQWDSISIVCVTANTTYAVTSAVGNLTPA